MVPSLSTRATRAAWPLNSGNFNGHGNAYLSGNATPTQADGQGRIFVLVLICFNVFSLREQNLYGSRS